MNYPNFEETPTYPPASTLDTFGIKSPGEEVHRRTERENPLSIPNLQARIRSWAISKGWRSDDKLTRSFGDDMALIASEVSEALEAFREHADPRKVWYTYTVEVEHAVLGPVKFKDVTRPQLMVLLDCDSDEELDLLVEDMNLVGKPEGVGPELADVMIRLLDTAEQYGLNLEEEVDYKMRHNDTRPWMHGGKHL